jgi:hypothetical protein
MLTGISVLNFQADGIVHQSATWVYLWHRQTARAPDHERNNFRSTELKRPFQSLECLSSFSKRNTTASSGTADESFGVSGSGAYQCFALENLAGADANRFLALAAYKDFRTLWKDGEPEIPILTQATAEYSKLQ